MSGWIGVDLDGTLAEYNGWIPGGGIGLPIPPMLERVKKWLAEGRDVRIFTARAAVYSSEREVILKEISDWCEMYVGRALPITNVKDFEMIELWDDRCVQVIPNTGRRADGKDDGLEWVEISPGVKVTEEAARLLKR